MTRWGSKQKIRTVSVKYSANRSFIFILLLHWVLTSGASYITQKSEQAENRIQYSIGSVLNRYYCQYLVMAQWDLGPIAVADGFMWFRPLSPMWFNETGDVMVWSSPLPLTSCPVSLWVMNVCLGLLYFYFFHWSSEARGFMCAASWTKNMTVFSHKRRHLSCSLWLICLCYHYFSDAHWWLRFLHVCLCCIFACDTYDAQAEHHIWWFSCHSRWIWGQTAGQKGAQFFLLERI